MDILENMFITYIVTDTLLLTWLSFNARLDK